MEGGEGGRYATATQDIPNAWQLGIKERWTCHFYPPHFTSRASVVDHLKVAAAEAGAMPILAQHVPLFPFDSGLKMLIICLGCRQFWHLFPRLECLGENWRLNWHFLSNSSVFKHIHIFLALLIVRFKKKKRRRHALLTFHFLMGFRTEPWEKSKDCGALGFLFVCFVLSCLLFLATRCGGWTGKPAGIFPLPPPLPACSSRLRPHIPLPSPPNIYGHMTRSLLRRRRALLHYWLFEAGVRSHVNID